MSIVRLKNKNGTIYVYENKSKWNKEKKRCDCKRKCIGHIDPVTGSVVANRPRGRKAGEGTKKVETTPNANLDSTANDITEGTKRVETSTNTKINATSDTTVKSVGITALLGTIAERLSLIHILSEVFPKIYLAILTCAYYLVAEGKALSHVESWSSDNITPFGGTLINQRVSDLLGAVSASKQLSFFKEWTAIRTEDEFAALDITSVSSYSEQNEFVRYGYNRDGENLPQINLCALVGEKTGIPMCYEVLNGAIKDVSSLKETISLFEWLKMSRVHLVSDKGFYSEANIIMLINAGFHFTIGVPFSLNWAKSLVESHRANIVSFENYREVGEDRVFAATETLIIGGRECYSHLYYDERRAGLQYSVFLEKIYRCQQELTGNKTLPSNQAYYEKYFDIKKDEKTKKITQVTPKYEAINAYKANRNGFFVLLSDTISDASEALRLYREKEAVENGFDDLKNALDMNRLRVHSSQNMQGRLFIQFIAQILMAQLRSEMKQSGLDHKYSLPELVNELKSIRIINLCNNSRYSTTISKKQNEILSLLSIDLNSYV